MFDIDGFTQAENPRKVQGKSECFHSCRYKIQAPDNIGSRSILSRKDLFQMCLDLLKKIQNLNTADKFFQETTTLNSKDSGNHELKKLQFEAGTMVLSPMDYSKILI